MVASNVWQRVLPAIFFVVACRSDSTAPATGGTDGACTPGTENCECIEGGQCITGLVCVSDECVSLDPTGAAEEEGSGGPKPETSTSLDPSDPSTSVGEESGGPVGSCEGNCGGSAMDGAAWCYCSPSCVFADDCCSDYETACPGTCTYHSQCEDDEVCSAEQECLPAYNHVYELTVHRWEDHTPTCWDTLDCLADVYFKIFYGTQGELYSSGIRLDTSTAAWDTEPVQVGINDTDVMVIAFYDSDDASADNLTNSVCFGVSECGPITLTALQTGGEVWDLRDSPSADERFYVEVWLVAQ